MRSASNTFGIAAIGLCLACSLAAAEPPATFKVSTLTFQRPQSWEWMEVSSPMRKAQLNVVGPDGKAAAEVIFFHFGPGNAGGTQANVDRWFGQFVESRDRIKAETEQASVGGHAITYVRAQGTFKSGMPGGPQTPLPDYALAGAIIEAKDGSVFIKMTGPKSLVDSAYPEFRRMVESGLK